MQRLLIASTLLHVFIALRLLPGLGDAGLPWWGLGLFALYLLTSSILMPLALLSRPMPQPRRDRLAWPGFIMMGAFSSLWVLTVLRDVVLIAGTLVSELLPLPGLTGFRESSAVGIPLAAAAMSAVGFVLARRQAPVRTVEVPIAGLPAALVGFTIAQITDVHVGATIKRDYVQAIVDATNAIEADLIAVTGDLVDGSVEQLSTHTAPLAGLRARHGTFFVTGNHEYYSGAHAWLVELRRLGLRVLMNEHVHINHDGAQLLVAGISDYNAHHFDPAHASDPAAALRGAPAAALRGAPEADFRLLLAHQPRSAMAAAPLGFDLQLSGHTHGGQFLPWRWFVRLQQPYTAGLHRMGRMWVYVSRGSGYWGPPMRLGAPSEITRLRLCSAPSNSAETPLS